MDCECDHCHYCGNWLGPHHEHDHYRGIKVSVTLGLRGATL